MNDTINRQQAIDTVLTYLVEHCGAAFDEDMQRGLVQALMDIPSTKQWIPCEEQLPDPGYPEYCLCCDDIGTIIFGYVFPDSDSATGYSAVNDFEFLQDCVAWLPRPKPYKVRME